MWLYIAILDINHFYAWVPVGKGERMPVSETFLFRASLALLSGALVLAVLIVVIKWYGRVQEQRTGAVLARLRTAYAGGWQGEALELARRHRAVAEQILLERMRAGDPAAAAVFTDLGFPAAYRRGARSPWLQRRAEVAYNLGFLPTDLNPEELLLALVRDRHGVVREAAIRALAQVGSARAAAAILAAVQAAGDQNLYRLARHALVGLGEAALPVVLAACVSPTSFVRRLALDVLTEVNQPVALGHLMPLAADPDLEIRLRVARALRFYDVPPVVAALLDLSADAEWPVRAQAARALSWVGGAGTVARLQVLAGDPSYWVRNNAIQSLTFKGEAGRAALLTLAAGLDAYASERAMESLEAMQREEERAWNASAKPSSS